MAIHNSLSESKEKFIDECLLPMQNEFNKRFAHFVSDEIAKLYGGTPSEIETVISKEDAGIEYCLRVYFNKIGRPEEFENFKKHLDNLKLHEEITKLKEKIEASRESAELTARQAFLDSYRLNIKVDVYDVCRALSDYVWNELVSRHFIKLAANELKADARYSGFVSDIEAAFDDIAIYTETLNVFDFIDKKVWHACPGNSGSGYFSCGDGQAVLLHDFLDKFGNVNHPFCNAKYHVMSKIFAPWFGERDIAGRLELRAHRVYDSLYRRYYDYRKLFFKNFPEQYEYSELHCAYFSMEKCVIPQVRGLFY